MQFIYFETFLTLRKGSNIGKIQFLFFSIRTLSCTAHSPDSTQRHNPYLTRDLFILALDHFFLGDSVYILLTCCPNQSCNAVFFCQAVLVSNFETQIVVPKLSGSLLPFNFNVINSSLYVAFDVIFFRRYFLVSIWIGL